MEIEIRLQLLRTLADSVPRLPPESIPEFQNNAAKIIFEISELMGVSDKVFDALVTTERLKKAL